MRHLPLTYIGNVDGKAVLRTKCRKELGPPTKENWARIASVPHEVDCQVCVKMEMENIEHEIALKIREFATWHARFHEVVRIPNEEISGN